MRTLSPNKSLNSGTHRDAGVEVICINSSFRGIHCSSEYILAYLFTIIIFFSLWVLFFMRGFVLLFLFIFLNMDH